jgi:hypothetical protein
VKEPFNQQNTHNYPRGKPYQDAAYSQAKRPETRGVTAQDSAADKGTGYREYDTSNRQDESHDKKPNQFT